MSLTFCQQNMKSLLYTLDQFLKFGLTFYLYKLITLCY